jgi:hypothetical protein
VRGKRRVGVDLEKLPDLGELVAGKVASPPNGGLTCFVNVMGLGIQFAALGALACENADDAYAELTGRGVQPNNQVEDAPWGRWFGVDDPDGNNWLITQERDG